MAKMIDTRVLRIDFNLPLEEQLQPAAEIIKNGGLVAFPTETVYGLGADGTNAEAAGKIYAAKGRPSDNPLIIHIANPVDAEKYTVTCDTYYRIAAAFMPGPITVVLPARDTVPRATRGGLDTVAVRCPENPVASTLIRLSGVPIAAPSANRSGSPSPTTANHVIDDMMGRVDMIVDGGDCDFGLESTIVSIGNDNSVTLLRPGKITVADIESLGISVSIADAVKDKLKDGEVAISPGMKYRHYAPNCEVILLDGDANAAYEYIGSYVANNNIEKYAVISYSEYVEMYGTLHGDVHIYDFGAKADEIAQAHSLFDILRHADKQDYAVVFAPLPRAEGIGLALYNRMIRAAAHKIIRL